MNLGPTIHQRLPLPVSPQSTCVPQAHICAAGESPVCNSRTEAALKFSESCNTRGLARTDTSLNSPKHLCLNPTLPGTWGSSSSSFWILPAPLGEDWLCSLLFIRSFPSVPLGGLAPLLYLRAWFCYHFSRLSCPALSFPNTVLGVYSGPMNDICKFCICQMRAQFTPTFPPSLSQWDNGPLKSLSYQTTSDPGMDLNLLFPLTPSFFMKEKDKHLFFQIKQFIFSHLW